MKAIVYFLTFLLFMNCSNANQKDYNVLLSEADKLYHSGSYKEAAEKYEMAIAIGNPEEYDPYYNAACCWALSGFSDKAFAMLNKTIDHGLHLYIDYIKQDKDLASLHSDKRWDELLAKLNENLENINKSLPDNQKETEVIKLPEPNYDGNYSVEKAINARRSVRSYKTEPLTLQECSQILWAAYGLTKSIEGGPAFLRGGLRAAPSAGALYPLDLYLVVGDVTELKAGVYKYDSKNHSLNLLTIGDKRKDLCGAALSQLMVEKAPASIVYSAIYTRTTGKYGQRGRERYVCMDLGHSAQNVYLQAQALGIGTCAIGAFLDMLVKQVVGMTKEEEPLYIMPLGKLKD